MRGGDNALFRIRQTTANKSDEWGNWSSLGQSIMGGPAAMRNQLGCLEVFAKEATTPHAAHLAVSSR